MAPKRTASSRPKRASKRVKAAVVSEEGSVSAAVVSYSVDSRAAKSSALGSAKAIKRLCDGLQPCSNALYTVFEALHTHVLARLGRLAPLLCKCAKLSGRLLFLTDTNRRGGSRHRR